MTWLLVAGGIVLYILIGMAVMGVSSRRVVSLETYSDAFRFIAVWPLFAAILFLVGLFKFPVFFRFCYNGFRRTP